MESDARKSSAFIARHSRHVSIDDAAVDKLAELIAAEVKMEAGDQLVLNMDSESHWTGTGHCHPAQEQMDSLEWIFVVDTMNFSFWTDDEVDSAQFSVTYKGEKRTGYYALCACVTRALDDGVPLTSAEYYSEITGEALRTILTDDNGLCLPMLDERLANLHEAGRVLLDKYDGRFANCVKRARSAQELLRLVLEEFPCYRDVATFEEERVALLKRAQILVADVFSCFNGKPPVDYSDIHTLTMFADYRVPQVFAYFGVLQYSEELWSLLRKRHSFENGERMEVEIRGNCIQAVDRLVAEVKDRRPLLGNRVTAATIDYFLWCFRRRHAAKVGKIPFHRCRTIYY